MSLLSAIPMRFFHESYYGRPSCPKCGEAMIAPEPQSTSVDVRLVTFGYVKSATMSSKH
jgi:hypothetical protein